MFDSQLANQLARAGLDAADQKADFIDQMASQVQRSETEAAGQRAGFDTQMAKAAVDTEVCCGFVGYISSCRSDWQNIAWISLSVKPAAGH